VIDRAVISFLRDKYDSAPRRMELPWTKFADMFRRPRLTSCVVVSCQSMNFLVGAKGEKLECPHKNGRSWSPAVYPAKKSRKKDFVEEVSFLVVDLDHLSDEQLAEALGPLSSYQRIVHASHSDRTTGEAGTCSCDSEPGAQHGTSCPARVDRCVRVIVALTRSVRQDEWSRFWRAAMTHLRQPADPSCCDANRLYYLPSRPRDAENYLVEVHDGAPLDVDQVLAASRDAGGSSGGAVESVASSLRFGSAGEVSPGQRHGMLKSIAGALRLRGGEYDDILAALLAANASRCRPPKPEEEVRRIARWAADQPVTTLPDSGRRGSLTVPHDADAEGVAAYEATADTDPDLGAEPVGGDRRSAEQLLCDERGRPHDTPRNIEFAMRRLGVRLRYDEFSGDEIVLGLRGYGPRLDDPAMVHLRLLIDARLGYLPGRDLFRDVIGDLARRDRFHPVRDYLRGLQWDGVSRIDGWLVDLGGAADSPYVRAVSRLLLVAAVRRVRQPGAKYDEMLILEGLQGSNKSSALRMLAVDDDWFTDDLPLGADTRRFMEATAGKWIVEAGELKGMGRGDDRALKQCLSRQRDEARLAYGHRSTRVARQFVAVGTTNETHGYFRDATGNRRYWPVHVAGFDLERLREVRDQLWAEAAVAEAAGESIRLDPQHYVAAAAEQEARLRGDDPLVDVLHRVLGERTGKLRVSDAYLICGIEPGKATQDQMERFGRAIRELGWERQRRRFDGALDYAYVKGSDAQRYAQLAVEYDHFSRSAKVIVERGSLDLPGRHD